MSSRDYERLSIEVFGRHLITSGDLDPVYIALHKVIWGEEQVNRFLVTYWCFYHCGFASYASEIDKPFWAIMRDAAHNEIPPPGATGSRWPRGSERRHARGAQGIAMVEDLKARYSHASEMVKFITTRSSPKTVGLNEAEPFLDISDRVKTHTLFGPWMAFKVADMVERVLGVPVDFEKADVFMFKDPMKAAEMLFCQRAGLDYRKVKSVRFDVGEVVSYLEETFSDLKAPPLMDRPIGLQEVETVLCKWKSHQNGHYPLNNDIDEINEGLKGWGKAAEEFAAAMPEAVR